MRSYQNFQPIAFVTPINEEYDHFLLSVDIDVSELLRGSNPSPRSFSMEYVDQCLSIPRVINASRYLNRFVVGIDHCLPSIALQHSIRRSFCSTIVIAE